MLRPRPERFRLVHVGTAAAALEELRRSPPSCVVLDLTLPDATGFDALDALTAAAPWLPIVVLTRRHDDAAGQVALQRGAQDYLIKDEASGASIARAIRYAMERAHTRRALWEGEERFRSAIEHLLDGYVIASAVRDPRGAVADFRVEYVNRAEVVLSGLAPEQCIGRLLSEAPDDLVPLDVRLRAAAVAQTGRPCSGRVLTVLRGEQRVVDYQLSRLGDGVAMTLRDVTGEVDALHALRDSEERLRTVVSNVPVVLVSFDRDGVWRMLEGAGLEAVKGDVAALIGRSALADRPHVPQVADLVRRTLDGYEVDTELELDGVTWEVRLRPVHDGDGRVAGGTGVAVDVTDRARAQEALRGSEQRFKALVQNLSDVIAVLDSDTTVRYISPSAARVYGLPDERSFTGRRLLELVHPDDAALVGAAFRVWALTPGSSDPVEYRIAGPDGAVRYLESIATNLTNEPSVSGIVLTTRDITERHLAEQRLTHQALHDPLTGLPNRGLFLDRLQHALDRVARHDGKVAVLFLDLDHFKVINDSLGHVAGDHVLLSVAEALQSCLRPGDTLARLGGDEFVVCSDELGDEQRAIALAERIHRRLREPLRIAGREMVLTASTGIVVTGRGDKESPESLLRNADAAMYRAKARGRSRYELFDEATGRRALDRLELEHDLRSAVERDQLRLVYQPEVSIADGRVVGVEALLRWHHPTRGMLSPLEFVPLAEETGLIEGVGGWVLAEACRQAARWRAARPGLDLTVAVNLSARQLAEPGLVDLVMASLRETGLLPGSLCLEITESVLMEEMELAGRTLAELRGIGVRLAVDDFGTGYSSLLYLKRVQVDLLKVDRSFVDGLGREPEDTTIVAAVVGLAHSLGLEAIAEGVETGEQLDALMALGCDVAQGYYLSAPLSAEDLVIWLDEHVAVGST